MAAYACSQHVRVRVHSQIQSHIHDYIHKRLMTILDAKSYARLRTLARSMSVRACVCVCVVCVCVCVSFLTAYLPQPFWPWVLSTQTSGGTPRQPCHLTRLLSGKVNGGDGATHVRTGSLMAKEAMWAAVGDARFALALPTPAGVGEPSNGGGHGKSERDQQRNLPTHRLP